MKFSQPTFSPCIFILGTALRLSFAGGQSQDNDQISAQDHRTTFNFTATSNVRNADLSRPFILTRVSYYDSQGKRIKNYLDASKAIRPLAPNSFAVEAVMISTLQQQGISFVSAGGVLEDKNTHSTTQ